MENLIATYEYDQAKIESERKLKKKSRYHKNYDPDTGKPIKDDDLDEIIPDFSDLEEEYERLSKESP